MVTLKPYLLTIWAYYLYYFMYRHCLLGWTWGVVNSRPAIAFTNVYGAYLV